MNTEVSSSSETEGSSSSSDISLHQGITSQTFSGINLCEIDSLENVLLPQAVTDTSNISSPLTSQSSPQGIRTLLSPPYGNQDDPDRLEELDESFTNPKGLDGLKEPNFKTFFPDISEENGSETVDEEKNIIDYEKSEVESEEAEDELDRDALMVIQDVNQNVLKVTDSSGSTRNPPFQFQVFEAITPEIFTDEEVEEGLRRGVLMGDLNLTLGDGVEISTDDDEEDGEDTASPTDITSGFSFVSEESSSLPNVTESHGAIYENAESEQDEEEEGVTTTDECSSSTEEDQTTQVEDFVLLPSPNPFQSSQSPTHPRVTMNIAAEKEGLLITSEKKPDSTHSVAAKNSNNNNNILKKPSDVYVDASQVEDSLPTHLLSVPTLRQRSSTQKFSNLEFKISSHHQNPDNEVMEERMTPEMACGACAETDASCLQCQNDCRVATDGKSSGYLDHCTKVFHKLFQMQVNETEEDGNRVTSDLSNGSANLFKDKTPEPLPVPPTKSREGVKLSKVDVAGQKCPCQMDINSLPQERSVMGICPETVHRDSPNRGESINETRNEDASSKVAEKISSKASQKSLDSSNPDSERKISERSGVIPNSKLHSDKPTKGVSKLSGGRPEPYRSETSIPDPRDFIEEFGDLDSELSPPPPSKKPEGRKVCVEVQVTSHDIDEDGFLIKRKINLEFPVHPQDKSSAMVHVNNVYLNDPKVEFIHTPSEIVYYFPREIARENKYNVGYFKLRNVLNIPVSFKMSSVSQLEIIPHIGIIQAHQTLNVQVYGKLKLTRRCLNRLKIEGILIYAAPFVFNTGYFADSLSEQDYQEFWSKFCEPCFRFAQTRFITLQVYQQAGSVVDAQPGFFKSLFGLAKYLSCCNYTPDAKPFYAYSRDLLRSRKLSPLGHMMLRRRQSLALDVEERAEILGDHRAGVRLGVILLLLAYVWYFIYVFRPQVLRAEYERSKLESGFWGWWKNLARWMTRMFGNSNSIHSQP